MVFLSQLYFSKIFSESWHINDMIWKGKPMVLPVFSSSLTIWSGQGDGLCETCNNAGRKTCPCGMQSSLGGNSSEKESVALKATTW